MAFKKISYIVNIYLDDILLKSIESAASFDYGDIIISIDDLYTPETEYKLVKIDNLPLTIDYLPSDKTQPNPNQINAYYSTPSVEPEIPDVNLSQSFKVVYADSLEKYNQLENHDMNTMYIIGEGNNDMIIFNNQLISNKGSSVLRL